MNRYLLTLEKRKNYFLILKNLKIFKKIKHIVLENEPNTLIKGTENKKGQNILRQNAEKKELSIKETKY